MITLKKTPDPENRHDVSTIEISMDNGLSMEELSELFKEFSLALGYHPSTVKSYFSEE